MPTRQDGIDRSNANDLPAMLRGLWDATNSLGFGALLAALRPRKTAFTGLTSSATQVHDKASIIYSVEATEGTPLAMITGSTVGAGEVSVEYDTTTGVPTFIFEAAVTAYIVNESGPLPQNLSTQMAEEL